MKPFRVLLSTLFAALLFMGVLAIPAQASDERTLFDGHHGQPTGWMNAIRATLGKGYLNVYIPDITTASNFTNPRGGIVVSPVRGNITAIYTVLTSSITGDLGLIQESVVIGDIGGVEITGGVITLASSSFSGTSDSATPTALNSVFVGSIIKFDSDGRSEAQMGLWIVIEVDRGN